MDQYDAKWPICLVDELKPLAGNLNNTYYRYCHGDKTFLPNTEITALFNNMRTLKFKSQPTNAFFATVNQMLGGSYQFPTNAERAGIKSNRRVQFSSEHLIDGSEKRICRLSFEFWSPHVIEKRSN